MVHQKNALETGCLGKVIIWCKMSATLPLWSTLKPGSLKIGGGGVCEARLEFLLSIQQEGTIYITYLLITYWSELFLLRETPQTQPIENWHLKIHHHCTQSKFMCTGWYVVSQHVSRCHDRTWSLPFLHTNQFTIWMCQKLVNYVVSINPCNCNTLYKNRHTF